MPQWFDIYIKLVIATLTFVAPLTALFLSVFARTAREKRHEYEQGLRQRAEQLKQRLSAEEASGVINQADLAVQEEKKHERLTQKQLRLLNPKWQLTRIFTTLFFALICSAVAVHESILNSTFFFIFIVVSILSYATGLIVLRQVLFNVIDIVASDNREEAK